jgi:beta-galactosidase
MKLGVCYYPEHWPETQWADDARRMAEMGLSRVRIGEFAWSRIEPEPGRYDWGWMDRAIETLHGAGLGVILGTPTATPSKWLIDQMPDMLAHDSHGRPRGFGSRRHYCFSHEGYAAECDRIVTALAERYGQHPAVVAWQTDNEYGCHDTAVSWSPAARAAFRVWLADKYGAVAALNAAWGNVFWSMEYRSFNEIELPNLTVTVPNPAHELDFRRFSSDQVAAFNRRQVAILRRHSPGRDIAHNFMGFFTQFDHHAVSEDIDVAGWDSYPLGFLEQFWFSAEDKLAYQRQGHPDIAAFHHDLYRGCKDDGRWWVLEQQPGPVNWARYNPAPLPGMVRLWTLEAMAHGAELLCYFRWRQAPFAQEQMHAGLLRPDSVDDIGAHEARQVAAEIAALPDAGRRAKQAALVFDYTSAWVTDIMPQGQGFSALRVAFEHYSALRRAGLDVDIVPPSADLSGYALVVLPCQPIVPDGLVAKLAGLTCPVLIGPRSGSKTVDFAIPPNLAPGSMQDILPLKVVRVESLRGSPVTWVDHVETELPQELPGLYCHGALRYLAHYATAEELDRIVALLATEAGLGATTLPEGLRISRIGDLVFAFNYSASAVALPDGIIGQFLLGGSALEPAGVAVGRPA